MQRSFRSENNHPGRASGHLVSLALLFLCLPVAAAGHPGWGIQVDSAGKVYFTDLERVYVADDAGRTEALLPDIHAHALYLDAEERLVGDHSWVDEKGVFHNGWWRLDHSGNPQALSEYAAAEYFGMPAQEGGRLMPESNVAQGRAEMIHLAPDGKRMVAGGGRFAAIDGTLADARFGVFGAHLPDGNGGLFLTSGGQLRFIAAGGRVSTLIGEEQGFLFRSDRRSGLLGISVTRDDNVLVADIDRRRLVKMNRRSGQVETVLEAGLAWTVTGVTVAGGAIYVLEYHRLPWSGAVRVRRLQGGGGAETVAQNR